MIVMDPTCCRKGFFATYKAASPPVQTHPILGVRIRRRRSTVKKCIFPQRYISRRSRDIETEVLPLSELNLLLLFFQHHWLLLSLSHHQQEILFLKSFRTNPNCVHGQLHSLNIVCGHIHQLHYSIVVMFYNLILYKYTSFKV